MKNKINLLGLTLVIIAGLSSCSSTKFMVDLDKTVDFTKYKTFEYFGWAEESNKLLNALDQQRIETAFGNEFKKRDMSYTEKDGDLIATLYIVTEQKTQTTANTTGGGYGGYGYGGYYGYGPAYGWGAGMSTTTYSEYDYTVGTLIIDLYDAKDKKLVWESIAKGTIKENPKGREARIDKIVQQMMLKYPIAVAK